MAAINLIDISGVGEITASRLAKQGIKAVQDVVDASKDDLCAATGFPELRVAGIQKAAASLLEQSGVEMKPKKDSKKKKKKDKKGKKKGKKKDKKKKKK